MTEGRRLSRVNLIGQIPLLRECSKRELQQVDRAAIQVEYDAGCVLCTEGAVGREVIMIIEGEARVERGGSQVALIGPGGFVGEISLLDGGPRTATVTTITTVTALVLPTPDFWQVIDEVPTITHRLLVTLAERLRLADGALYPPATARRSIA